MAVSMNFEQRVREYGSAECVYCGAAFTRENPCVNDCGFIEDRASGDGMLHIEGECLNCADKRGGNLRRVGEPTNNDL